MLLLSLASWALADAPPDAARARYESLHLARTHELRWRVVDGRGVEIDVDRWAYLT
ncbi:MAG: hypothetical protein FJ102_16125, partial [Deltaproteobacteria bacterium]|nr:hypothetical protein [Deltaproteobacteria bacterium]